MTDELKPKDEKEAVALLPRAGDRAFGVPRRARPTASSQASYVNLSQQRFMPPGALVSRHYSVPTLQRWYYAYRRGGLQALEPMGRSDRGHGRALSDEQKQLLVDVRRDHPRVSSALILRTLVFDGRLEEGLITETTLRRFYTERGLDRKTLAQGGPRAASTLADRAPERALARRRLSRPVALDPGKDGTRFAFTESSTTTAGTPWHCRPA